MTPLPPELLRLHLADLRRAFQLVAEYEHHDIGKLPGALLDRLKENGYVVTVDGKVEWEYMTAGMYRMYENFHNATMAFLKWKSEKGE